jgi:hypothetical protein
LTAKLLAVSPGNCGQRLVLIPHFDKGKPTGFEGFAVDDDLDGFHFAERLKFSL